MNNGHALATIENVLITGNLASLTPEQKIQYHNKVCELVGLNPLTKPFEYISFQGKTVLYAGKNCAEQLRKIHNISITSCDHKTVNDMLIVTVTAQDQTGRKDVGTAAIPISGLKGDALANTIMKAETKAKRRVTLSICSLGMLDESEIETIPGAKLPPRDVTPKFTGSASPSLTQMIPETKPGRENIIHDVSDMEVIGEVPQRRTEGMQRAMNFANDTSPIVETDEQETRRMFTNVTDWTQYKFRYHLPYKKTKINAVTGEKEVVDMQSLRDYVKKAGWKWRPSKDKDKNPIPGGDDCWYTNDFSEKLHEYCKDNPEYQKPFSTPFNDGDDIPF